TTAPRHLLFSPSAEPFLDPAATGAALDTLDAAPGTVGGDTGTLMAATDQQEWTTDPRSQTGELYALERLVPGEVRPSDRAEGGNWAHLDSTEDPQLLDPGALTGLEDAWDQVDTLAAAMEDDAPLEAPRREIIAGT